MKKIVLLLFFVSFGVYALEELPKDYELNNIKTNQDGLKFQESLTNKNEQDANKKMQSVTDHSKVNIEDDKKIDTELKQECDTDKVSSLDDIEDAQICLKSVITHKEDEARELGLEYNRIHSEITKFENIVKIAKKQTEVLNKQKQALVKGAPTPALTKVPVADLRTNTEPLNATSSPKINQKSSYEIYSEKRSCKELDSYPVMPAVPLDAVRGYENLALDLYRLEKRQEFENLINLNLDCGYSKCDANLKLEYCKTKLVQRKKKILAYRNKLHETEISSYNYVKGCEEQAKMLSQIRRSKKKLELDIITKTYKDCLKSN